VAAAQIFVYKAKGGGGDVTVVAKTSRKAPCETGFTCAQISRKGNNLGAFKIGGKVEGNILGLFGGCGNKDSHFSPQNTFYEFIIPQIFTISNIYLQLFINIITI
jgi:hypothetical protein